jgi:hypothetical protein
VKRKTRLSGAGPSSARAAAKLLKTNSLCWRLWHTTTQPQTHTTRASLLPVSTTQRRRRPVDKRNQLRRARTDKTSPLPCCSPALSASPSLPWPISGPAPAPHAGDECARHAHAPLSRRPPALGARGKSRPSRALPPPRPAPLSPVCLCLSPDQAAAMFAALRKWTYREPVLMWTAYWSIAGE